MEDKSSRYPVAKNDFRILKDEDPMPYGQHKGKQMKDVPGKYLLWMMKENKLNRSLIAYVTDNKKRLEGHEHCHRTAGKE